MTTPATDLLSSKSEVESFAEWFVRSPLARAMIEDGQPYRIFLPIRSREHDGWDGVEITIACVSGVRAMQERDVLAPDGLGPDVLGPPERGNGYSANPPGPLKPGDFGVHSHPDTTRLMEPTPVAALWEKRRR